MKTQIRRVAGRTYRHGRDIPYRLPLPAPARGASDTIISLTSFPERIGHVHVTIESLRRQEVRPAGIVLVLAESQFPGRHLPRRLRALARHTVDILWTKRDTRSYKKLLPTLGRYPEVNIITVDDDVIYRRWFLKELLRQHARTPGCIVGHVGKHVTLVDGRPISYSAMEGARPGSPHMGTLLVGVGGILYPPIPRFQSIVADIDAALEICPTADDLWFWASAKASGTPTARSGAQRFPCREVEAQQTTVALSNVNMRLSRNDTQLRDVIDHFSLLPILEELDA